MHEVALSLNENFRLLGPSIRSANGGFIFDRVVKLCGAPCTFSFENILCRLNWAAFQGVDSASLGAISTSPPDEEGEGEDALRGAPFPSNDNILPIGTYWFPRSLLQFFAQDTASFL